jgi:hypothetical protein
VIVAAHVASGAAGGALVRSRLWAVALGAVLHALEDAIPHRDFPSRRFEVASGLAGIAALAWRRGLLDQSTLGAVACAMPDLEHVLPLPRPGGRKLFPSHRIEGWHRAGGVRAGTQLAAAAAILALLLRD